MKFFLILFSILASSHTKAMDIPAELRQSRPLHKILKEFGDIFNAKIPIKMNLSQRAAHLRSLAAQIIKHPETNRADKFAFSFFENLDEKQLKSHYLTLLDPWQHLSQRTNSSQQELINVIFKPKL